MVTQTSTPGLPESFPMYHLAQFNVARFRYPSDHPGLEGFTSRLDSVNALAESSPGFVWRFQDETGNAMAVQAFDDPRVLLNLSVWETWEHLKAYVYSGGHLEVMRRRAEWIEPHAEPHLVMWWVAAGHIPTIEEAKARLDRLRTEGPTRDAFTPRTIKKTSLPT